MLTPISNACTFTSRGHATYRKALSSSTFVNNQVLANVLRAATTDRRRFVSGDANAGGTKIDYSSLPHPGPELGEAAVLGKVLRASSRLSSSTNLAVATFAGGCFWGLELAYQRIEGVEYTAVGYTQGRETFPTYEQVCAGKTSHTEAIIVYYDDSVVSYSQLLAIFFGFVDPITVNGQGRDLGAQYRTGIYYHTKGQEEEARTRFVVEQEKYRRPIATECKAATPFWPAELYHQQYLEKGGRRGRPQSAAKGATEAIRCYG